MVKVHRFKKDVLSSSVLKNFTSMNLLSLVNEYDNCLHTILDNHSLNKSSEIIEPVSNDSYFCINVGLKHKWWKPQMFISISC